MTSAGTRISLERRAKCLQARAQGLSNPEAAKRAGVSERSVRNLRAINPEDWDTALRRLRDQIADGTAPMEIAKVARSIIASWDRDREVEPDLEPAPEDVPLTWSAIASIGQQLFAARLSTAEDPELRARLEPLASDEYWADARERAARHLGVSSDQLDLQPPPLLFSAAMAATAYRS